MKTLAKTAAALFAMWVIAGPAAISSALADRLDEVKARGKLIVGVSDTTPPFSFKKAGETTVTGYDLDIVHAVAKRLGVSVDTVSLSSAERIPMLNEGKIDFAATSMTRTAERLKEIDFSYIYFVTPHAVIVKKSSGITSVHQLAGKKASSASTSTAGPNLKEAEPKVELVYVRDYAQAFDLLKQDKVDAFPTDESVLRAIVQQDGHPDDYLFVSDFTKSRNVGFALKKGEPRFKEAINKALLDVEASGDAVKIYDAWFGPKSPEPMARKFKIQAD
ncbi:transporter substrate-binding domain-containing protein [Rhodoplanes sp. Z2-YC6860]|uniref:transporter substrate-binding domain-containing protein n=1 Tax=Rhodoplanes sp. Z2-YC6860 TaxID=674703 RepID=UPI00078CB07C|nr:transporter substrate-binding domain-containing protein [Rhodoplanes sp. Z2-YC6860]AMN45117.1 amino acid ABC transporter substrate-binding protein [Rhodoplanes sp. Z2-YC6860]